MLTKAPAVHMAAFALGLGSLLLFSPVQAEGFGPMNMMNPSRWFGGKDRDYDDLPPPGYGGPYGAPGPGPGYGAPGLGYAAPGPGYGAPLPVPGAGYPPMSNAYGVPGYLPPTGPTGYSVAPPPQGNYGVPGAAQAPGYGTTYAPPSTNASEGPSRAEMAGRIEELEQRLREMEANARAAAPAPEPTTPPPSSYQYYSGDQTPAYPFRPMDLGK